MDIIHNTSFLKRYLEKSLTCWGLIVEDKILLKGIKENIVEKNIMIMNGRLNIVKKSILFLKSQQDIQLDCSNWLENACERENSRAVKT